MGLFGKKKTDIHFETYQNTRYAVPNSARAGHNRWGDNKRWADKMHHKHGYFGDSKRKRRG